MGHFTLGKILKSYYSFHLNANSTIYSLIFLSISFLGSLLYANYCVPLILGWGRDATLQDW